MNELGFEEICVDRLVDRAWNLEYLVSLGGVRVKIGLLDWPTGHAHSGQSLEIPSVKGTAPTHPVIRAAAELPQACGVEIKIGVSRDLACIVVLDVWTEFSIARLENQRGYAVLIERKSKRYSRWTTSNNYDRWHICGAEKIRVNEHA